MENQKRCPRCGEKKDISDFCHSRNKKDGHNAVCKKCCNDYQKQPAILVRIRNYKRYWRHATERCRPMSEARDTASFLGVHVAEQVLSKFFDHLERMPMNNPGFDFICSKGYKIDAKSSCLLHSDNRLSHWHFGINKNKIADYFICLAFDNRDSLTPLHVWLLPGDAVNNRSCIRISDTPKGLAKWAIYEKSLDRVIFACERIAAGGSA